MEISVTQFKNNGSIDENIKKIKNIILKNSSKVYVFPECALTGYNLEKQVFINYGDERLIELQRLCVQLKCIIFIGAAIKTKEGLFNSYLCIEKEINLYHKTHLGENEKEVFDEGKKINVLFNKNIKIGASICIETHIPDQIQTLALKGCELVLAPFATPEKCGQREKIWNKYLPTRAYDNCIFIIAVNLSGNLNEKNYGGGIEVIKPDGEIQISHFKKEEYTISTKIDILEVEKRRKNKKTNFLNKRKQHLYE